MFGKVAADLLGLSDLGAVIKPENYDKVDADDYILHEDQEKIYFVIKSKSDEYCFTNLALLHLDGDSAISKKRILHRYAYSTYKVADVTLETAGTVDLDVEIKFSLGGTPFSIDVSKKYLEDLKDLYKALIKIAEITHENEISLSFARQSLDMATATVSQIHKAEIDLSEQFKAVNQIAFNWLTDTQKQFKSKDFGTVFDRYMHH
ncbi:PH domain-containing protein [Paenibacillus sp. MWE-103]|uniref:PH domain-containing protein n=1 Tax=Paenibacillus artemisiicola TaxID=1172618 RepID=A0ABS3WIT0_9BACL|nr:PH domain-containing protein [Paenibacillus artemisiicola]MBO7748236.1 PH domain-containing protein [Paenibacillus artemisiicola]